MQTRRSRNLTTVVPPKRHTFRFEIFNRAIIKRDKQIDQGTYHPKRSPSFISVQRHGPHEPAVRSNSAASRNTGVRGEASAVSDNAPQGEWLMYTRSNEKLTMRFQAVSSAETPLDIRCERGPPPPKRAGVDISLRKTTERDVNSTMKVSTRRLHVRSICADGPQR